MGADFEAQVAQLVLATRVLMAQGVEISEIRRTLFEITAALGLGTEFAEGQRVVEMVFDRLEAAE